MSRKPKTPFPIFDEVDEVRLRVYKAICELIMIAGAYHDEGLAARAVEALVDLGSLAAVPLTAVIEQIPSESRRLRMVVALRDIPQEFGFHVLTVLTRVKAADPSGRVRAAAAETLTILRKRSHEWFGRQAARQAALMEDRVGASTTTGGDDVERAAV
jgi:hypothetical protein